MTTATVSGKLTRSASGPKDAELSSCKYLCGHAIESQIARTVTGLEKHDHHSYRSADNLAS